MFAASVMTGGLMCVQCSATSNGARPINPAGAEEAEASVAHLHLLEVSDPQVTAQHLRDHSNADNSGLNNDRIPSYRAAAHTGQQHGLNLHHMRLPKHWIIELITVCELSQLWQANQSCSFPVCQHWRLLGKVSSLIHAGQGSSAGDATHWGRSRRSP